MQKFNKKLIGILLTLVILISGISTVSGMSLNNENPETSEEENQEIQTVTLYRYGPDGSISTMKINVELEEGQDINDAIEEKCLEILEDDEEIQGLLNENVTRNALSRVRSRGRGLHLKFTFTISWLKKYDIFPLLPPYIFRRIRIPIVYCRYPNDLNAKTVITPVLDKDNITEEDDPHSVLCVGFIGFKWWIGHVSLIGFGLRTGFVGFSLYTKTNKL